MACKVKAPAMPFTATYPHLPISTTRIFLRFRHLSLRFMGRFRKAISVSVKLEAVSYAAQHSLSAAAAKYCVDRKSIRTWRAKKEKIESSNPKRFCSDGGGRKPKFPELEEQLFEFFQSRRQSKLLSVGLGCRKPPLTFTKSYYQKDFTDLRLSPPQTEGSLSLWLGTELAFVEQQLPVRKLRELRTKNCGFHLLRQKSYCH